MLDAGDRFMSMQVINEDESVPQVFYGKGEHTLTRDEMPSINITAATSLYGSVTVQFRGCTPSIPNCLPIMPGWNYLIRRTGRKRKSSTASGHSLKPNRFRNPTSNR